jgi:rhodanese-related sulfurtransferase
MRTVLFASAIALAALAACSKDASSSSGSSRASEAVTSDRIVDVAAVTIDQLDTMLTTGGAQPIDANGNGTRKKLGVIPGAVLLSDSETYDIKELPADKAKPLVFYCANTSCGASHDAAHKAIASGYTNVKVFPEGISGWVKAGKKTQSI